MILGTRDPAHGDAWHRAGRRQAANRGYVITMQ
jgi:hypothetical protein